MGESYTQQHAAEQLGISERLLAALVARGVLNVDAAGRLPAGEVARAAADRHAMRAGIDGIMEDLEGDALTRDELDLLNGLGHDAWSDSWPMPEARQRELGQLAVRAWREVYDLRAELEQGREAYRLNLAELAALRLQASEAAGEQRIARLLAEISRLRELLDEQG